MESVVVLAMFAFLTFAPWRVLSEERLLVNMTLSRSARALGALCLDGSLPAYHFHRGFGAGANNWLLQFEEYKLATCDTTVSSLQLIEILDDRLILTTRVGGGWCNDVESCAERAKTRRGSTRYMTKLEVFSGILSNNASLNPDFYNWNRVKIRYCDGGSFTGDALFNNGTTLLYFKGQKIWESIIRDLRPKGLDKARKALLSGCSAGGLATFHHCDNFASYLPKNASVKCLSDAGFFLDGRDIALNHTMRYFFKSLVLLQGIERNLNRNCTRSLFFPDLCFFPQYVFKYITTPYFILNSAYDVFQFHHILVPPSSDLRGHWNHCKINPAACTPDQIDVLQGFRRHMLAVLRPFYIFSRRGGMFINSCFAHCQSESQDTWFGDDSPKINDKTIAETVGDWYFGRDRTKEIDCAYPCDKTCHNLIPEAQVDEKIGVKI